MGIAATRTTGVTQTPSAAPVATLGTPYDIGTPGTPWGPTERAAWLQRFRTHLDRSFFDPQVPLASGPRLPRKNATHASSGIPSAA